MAVVDETGEGMQCTEHPYHNNPGGICAFCLQQKLSKLVSSSTGSTPFLSVLPSSSSSSPDCGTVGPAATRTAGSETGDPDGRRKMPFLSGTTKNGSDGGGVSKDMVVLKRSKSVAPRWMGAISNKTTPDSPRKKSFWSFLHLPFSSSATSTSATSSSGNKKRSTSSGSDNGSRDLKKQQQQQTVVPTKTCMNGNREDQEAAAVRESPGGIQASSSSLGRRVGRSRSVGCGSRRFSCDFLERISTGFGDCAHSQESGGVPREPSNHGSKRNNNKMMAHHHDDGEQRIKERMKCGGIFGGFGLISSSSTYWLSVAATAAGEDDFDGQKNQRRWQ